MVDFKVTVYDGSYHDVDSSELAFKLAARKAFKAAMQEAKPALLEPVMNVEIQAPVEYAGDLMGDLNGRRGRISGMETKGSTQFIRAQVPMAEMLNYQSDLTAMTQGRASFTHGVRPLRFRAATAGREDHRRRQGRQDRAKRKKRNRTWLVHGFGHSESVSMRTHGTHRADASRVASARYRCCIRAVV